MLTLKNSSNSRQGSDAYAAIFEILKSSSGDDTLQPVHAYAPFLINEILYELWFLAGDVEILHYVNIILSHLHCKRVDQSVETFVEVKHVEVRPANVHDQN